jgi:hypothetical protein
MILLFCISSTTSLIFKLLSGYELVKNGMLQTESGIIETVLCTGYPTLTRMAMTNSLLVERFQGESSSNRKKANTYQSVTGIPITRLSLNMQQMGRDLALCARGLGKRYRNYVASLSYGLYTRPIKLRPMGGVVYSAVNICSDIFPMVKLWGAPTW